MKEMKKITMIIIILSMALIFFVGSFLIAQKLDNFEFTIQVYAISFLNAMIGAVIGLCVVTIIRCPKKKKFLFIHLSAVMCCITDAFFALGFISLRTDAEFFLIGGTFMLITMLSCILAMITSIKRALKDGID